MKKCSYQSILKLGLFFLISTSILFPQHATSYFESLGDVFADVAENVVHSVVVIESETIVENAYKKFYNEDFFRFFHFEMPEEFRGEALGSGVIVRSDGIILTNNHVIENAEDIHVVLYDGKKYKADIVGRDSKSDIAVLQIDEKNLPVIPLGDSDQIRVGNWVLAVGSPFSDQLAYTVTHGIISAKGRSSVGLAEYEDFIQTDAAINPGNSGGALVNLRGELIGISTAMFSRTGGNMGIGFAIPINMIKRVIDDLLEHGYVTRAWLRVYIQDVDDVIRKRVGLDNKSGAIISQIIEGSPAEKEELQIEDVIIKVDEKLVENSSQLRNIIGSKKPDDMVELTIIRNTKEKTIQVKLGESPENDTSALPFNVMSKIGIQVEEITIRLQEKFGLSREDNGLLIVNVNPMSNAFAVGIRTGDVILEINSESITTIKEFHDFIHSLEVGDEILFRLKRDEHYIFHGFTIG